jgi:CheY-like chemotaxis protein
MPKKTQVLLVEDNPGDIQLTQEAFVEGRVPAELHAVNDGDTAISLLRAKTGRNRKPDLILLDLNLPRRNGWEVLDILKKDNDLKLIPVVILTSSSAEKDIWRAYAVQANCYVVKPADFDDFVDVVRKLSHFWFSIAQLPN